MPLPEQRSVKRKRPHDEESEEDKEAMLRRKLHHALRELRKVVGKARTFEIQKTLKKLKDARRKVTESDVTKDLVAQMEILKHLNYDRLAYSALLTKLKKDKTLSANPFIQAISVELVSNLPFPATPATLTARVQSRILSSKVLASEVTTTVENLKMFLHPPVGPAGIRTHGGANDSRASPNISKKRKARSDNNNEACSSKDDMVDLSGEERDGTSEDTSDDEALAEADDGWESGTVGVPSESVAGVADDDDTSSQDYSEANFPSKGLPKPQTHGPKGQSEFLPSLSVGFIRGDSGSEFSDSGEKLVDRMKKNRRGQRARRALWEKKFGKNANHIKKRRQRDTERCQPGSAPVDRQSGKGNFHRMPMQSRALSYRHEQVPGPNLEKSDGVRGSSSTRGLLDRNDDHRGKRGERPLHPSWEARKKQKSAGIVPSQGTKIVFSESL